MPKKNPAHLLALEFEEEENGSLTISAGATGSPHEEGALGALELLHKALSRHEVPCHITRRSTPKGDRIEKIVLPGNIRRHPIHSDFLRRGDRDTRENGDELSFGSRV